MEGLEGSNPLDLRMQSGPKKLQAFIFVMLAETIHSLDISIIVGVG
jgi:hypothetical protein